MLSRYRPEGRERPGPLESGCRAGWLGSLRGAPSYCRNAPQAWWTKTHSNSFTHSSSLREVSPRPTVPPEVPTSLWLPCRVWVATVQPLLLPSVDSRPTGCCSCCRMQDLPGPGMEPGSPALAGGFLSCPTREAPDYFLSINSSVGGQGVTWA